MLLEPHHDEVGCDEAQDDARDNQHVQDVEAIQHQVGREVATENSPVQPGTNDRQTQDDGGHDAQTNTGEQVIREGVTEEALDHTQEDECATDNPVSLTRTAEGAGEEDAEHVGNHGHHEHECCPVVHLADEETAANLEGEVQRRCVGARHLDAVERGVGTVVDDLRDGRVKEQCKVNTGQQQDDEAVQRHLTKHEGPVSRKDFVELGTQDAGGRVALVHVVAHLGKFVTHYDLRSQNAGPTGSTKLPLATM